MFDTVTLSLSATEKLVGLRYGCGHLPCLIVGPGSFYWKLLSDNLKAQFTFYCFDGLWTAYQEEKVSLEQIKEQTFASLSQQVEKIVEVLKKDYGYDKVGLMGFSAPGLLALKAAIVLSHNHVSYVIGVSLAIMSLDSNFNRTDTYFMKHADSQRIAQREMDEQEFNQLTSSPTKSDPWLWLSMLRKIRTKQLDDYSNVKLLNQFCQAWANTPDGKILNEAMRCHFFDLLQGENPEQIIAELTATDIPLMLAYGQHDFTTPAPSKITRATWKNTVSFFKYPGSIHYPYFEQRSQNKFDNDLLDFINGKTKSSATLSMTI